MDRLCRAAFLPPDLDSRRNHRHVGGRGNLGQVEARVVEARIRVLRRRFHVPARLVVDRDGRVWRVKREYAVGVAEQSVTGFQRLWHADLVVETDDDLLARRAAAAGSGTRIAVRPNSYSGATPLPLSVTFETSIFPPSAFGNSRRYSSLSATRSRFVYATCCAPRARVMLSSSSRRIRYSLAPGRRSNVACSDLMRPGR